jgi:hypothetical protein
MKILNVSLYDQHSWEGSKEMSIVTDHAEVNITLRDLSDRPSNMDFYLICDELVDTPFPLFFPKSKRIAVLKETPGYYASFSKKKMQNRFRHVFTHVDAWASSLSNARLVEFSSNWVSRDPNWTGLEDKTKLVSFIGNIIHHETIAYDFRREVAEFALSNQKIDAYGKGVKPVEYKSEALANYRFSIALENSQTDFYFTEKIIDCFLSSTIPIYYGCPRIDRYYDERGMFVFDSIETLKDIVDELSEGLYEKMLPYVIENKKRCLDYKHDSFSSYWYRIASHLSTPKLALINSTSKPAAAVRFAGEKIGISI